MRPIYETALVGPWVARSSSILCGARRQPRRRLCVFLLCLQRGTGRNEAGGEVAPQRHHQFARQRNDGDAPGALAGVGDTGVEPAAEFAFRLMPQPQPGQLDRLKAGARIAGLADALLAIDAAAAPWTWRQSAIGGDLAPVVEVLAEQLAGQRGGEGRAERLEPLQLIPPLRHRFRNARNLRSLGLLQRRK